MTGKPVTIFEPGEKSQLDEYPELAEVEEFRSLSREEMRFVWYFGNQTSPFFELDPMHVKISKCYDKAFDKNPKEAQKQKYLSQHFGTAIMAAIKRMRLYNPSLRARAEAIVHKAFQHNEDIINNFKAEEEIVELNEEGLPTGKVTVKKLSPGALKDYVDLMTKITANLSELVNTMETGFGVKRKTTNVDGGTISLFDRVMERRAGQ